MCSNLLPDKKCNEFRQKLLNQVKETNLTHFWFSSSGSMANDLASQIIFHNKDKNSRLLAFDHCFAGKSTITNHISSFDKKNFTCSLPVDYISPFKNPLEELERLWKKHGSDYQAILIELVGNKSGKLEIPTSNLQEIINWAKNHNLVVWVDEVQSFGRTTELFAFNYFNISSHIDIVTLGKALQVSGILYSSKLSVPPDLLGGTFCGSLSAITFADKVLPYLAKGNFYGNNGKIAKIEQSFREKLEKMKNKKLSNPISNIQSTGTFISFTIGDSKVKLTMKFINQLFKNGIISFMNGTTKKNISLLIPLSILDEHIEEICKIIEKTANTNL